MVSSQTDRLYGLEASLAFKAPVVIASTGSALTLSGTQTIDGISVSTGMRVLVKDQAGSTENGIYEVRNGAWARTADCNGARDIMPGTSVYVDRGNTWADTFWIFNSSSTEITPVIGSSDPIVLSQVTPTISNITPGTVTPAGGNTSRTIANWLADRVNIYAYGAAGDGVTDDSDALFSAQADAGSSRSIWFPHGTFAVSSALTLTAGLTFEKGILKPTSGVTVTVAGKVAADSQQIFDVSATQSIVTFSTLSLADELNGRWWGMVGDDDTNNTNQFQQMLNAMVASSIPGYVPSGIYAFDSDYCWLNSAGSSTGVGITNAHLRGAGKTNGSQGEVGTELKNIGMIFGNGAATSTNLPDSEGFTVRDIQIRGYVGCHGIQQGWSFQNMRIVPRSPATAEGLYMVSCLVGMFYNVRVDFGSTRNGIFAESVNKFYWFGGGVSNCNIGIESGDRNQSGTGFDWQFHGLYFEDNATSAMILRKIRSGAFHVSVSGNSGADWVPLNNPLVIIGATDHDSSDTEALHFNQSFFRANPTGAVSTDSVAISVVNGRNIDVRDNRFRRIETCVAISSGVDGYLIGGDTFDGDEMAQYAVTSGAVPLMQHGPWRFDAGTAATIFQVYSEGTTTGRIGFDFISSTGGSRHRVDVADGDTLRLRSASSAGGSFDAEVTVDGPNGLVNISNGSLQEAGVRAVTSSGAVGGSTSGSSGAQYVAVSIAGTIYKLLHDGTTTL